MQIARVRVPSSRTRGTPPESPGSCLGTMDLRWPWLSPRCSSRSHSSLSLPTATSGIRDIQVSGWVFYVISQLSVSMAMSYSSVATFCFVCVCGEGGCLVEVGLLVVCNFFLFILIIFSSLPLVITLVSSLVVSVIMNASFSCLLLSPPHEFYVVVFIYLCFFYALALLFLLSTALQFGHVYISSRVELHLEDVQMKHFYVLFSAFFFFLDMA